MTYHGTWLLDFLMELSRLIPDAPRRRHRVEAYSRLNGKLWSLCLVVMAQGKKPITYSLDRGDFKGDPADAALRIARMHSQTSPLPPKPRHGIPETAAPAR